MNSLRLQKLTDATDWTMRKQAWSRDAWNLYIGKIWSRSARDWFLRRVVGALGEGAVICRNVTLFDPARITIGARSVINGQSVLDGRQGLVIEHDVDIANSVQLWTLEHDYDSPTHGTRGAPIHIADHVWIGARAMVLPGVSVGRGAVVAAGSVVTRDVPPLTIVAGIPARPIGMRKNPLSYKLHFGGRFR